MTNTQTPNRPMTAKDVDAARHAGEAALLMARAAGRTVRVETLPNGALRAAIGEAM